MRMHVVYEIKTNDGCTAVIRARLAATTGEHLSWPIALCHNESLSVHVVEYATRFVDSIRIDKHLEDGSISSVHGMSVETLSTKSSISSIMRLCELVATYRALPKDFAENYQQWWAVIFGAHAYDPDKAAKTCDCLHCKAPRAVQQDDTCLFWGIDESAQILGSYDWELARECWDLPIEVYQMLLSQRRQQTLGSAADRQKREEDREQTAKTKAANSPRSWNAATAAREKALEKRRSEQVKGANNGGN